VSCEQHSREFSRKKHYQDSRKYRCVMTHFLNYGHDVHSIIRSLDNPRWLHAFCSLRYESEMYSIVEDSDLCSAVTLAVNILRTLMRMKCDLFSFKHPLYSVGSWEILCPKNVSSFRAWDKIENNREWTFSSLFSHLPPSWEGNANILFGLRMLDRSLVLALWRPLIWYTWLWEF